MRKYLLIIPVLFLITSCEDVVEIDTPTEPPRLFVDAVIRVDTEMEMTNVSFTVGETSNFFDEPQPAELNEIQITNIGYESNNEHELPWQPYSLATLDENLRANRTVMIDFTADW